MMQKPDEAAVRVALLAPALWPEVRRGTERVVDQLGVGLSAAGYAPTVIAGHPGRLRTDDRGDYPVVLVPRIGEHVAQRLLRAHERVGHLPAERIALARLRPRLVHSFYPTDAALAGGWSGKNDGASVFSVMGMPDPIAIRARRLRRGLWQRALGRANAVVVLSEAARALAREIGCEPEVIHPGTDLQAFTRTQERADEPTIVCPAAIGDERKRVPLLVEAFRLVRRRYPRARLILSAPDPTGTIAGEGVEVRDLDSREALAGAYSEAWLTVLPSLQEAFGLVLVESLACGTAVLASDDAGCPEVIGDSPEVGSTFTAATDSSRLAETIRGALERFGNGQAVQSERRDRAREFSADVAISKHLELYSRLLA